MHRLKDIITVYYDGGCPRCIRDMHTYGGSNIGYKPVEGYRSAEHIIH